MPEVIEAGGASYPSLDLCPQMSARHYYGVTLWAGRTDTTAALGMLCAFSGVGTWGPPCTLLSLGG